MDIARIAELLEPFLGSAGSRQLTTGDLTHISIYVDLLLRWNTRVNLTAVRDPEQIIARHFGESLFAAHHLFPSRSSVSSAVKTSELADVGSGAGFPGLPIKLWAPELSVTLIESNHKKAAFLREAVRALTLTDINIIAARADTIFEHSFDLVTLRAVERFADVLPVSARLVAPTGRLALLISSAQLEKVHASLPRLTWDAPIAIPLSDRRIVVVAHRPSHPEAREP